MSTGELRQSALHLPGTHEPHAKLVTILVAAAFFMENLDGTVIATALPQMAVSFRSNPVDLNMGMTAYMLMLAVFIPVSGWLADRLGARTVFSSAIAIFTMASIVCGVSQNLWQFTAARVVQGIGGAMMVPVGRLVVLRVTEKKNLMQAISYIVWPGLAAPVLGPPLGGFITTYSSWRWIFYLNVPLGIVALALALWWIRNEPTHEERPFDWMGFALAGTSCIALMYGLELLGQRDAPWSLVGVFIGYALLAGWGAVRHLRKAEHPLINFACLRFQTFAVSIWGGTAFRVAIMASPFLLPLMFQVAFGMNAFQSGILVLAMFAGNFAMKSVTSPLLRRYGFRTVLVVNAVITAALLMACGFLLPQTPRWAIMTVLFLHGLSRSMHFTALNTLAFVDIPKPLMSSATSFYSVVQQMGIGMGVAMGAVTLRAAAFLRGERGAIPSLTDFHVALWTVGALSLLALIDCVTLDPRAGAEVSGHDVSDT
ncbi:MAG: MFS transporter [Bryobacterales bacterium]|nr:MFS transporter [Bryobacterales bacterium]